jgi:hypothetical protein
MIDDLVITGADREETTRARRQLTASFEMKNQGDLHCFLGIQEIRTSPEGILMNQRHYALSIRFKFRMAEWKPIPTPLGRTVKLHPDSSRVCGRTRFRQIVGSLIYLTITRPDLSYLVGVISWYMARPTEEHLQSALRILRYVSGIKDRGLLYRAGTTEQLAGYTDADWASNAANRRSTSGYAFSIGSTAIAWSSKEQPTVSLSSTEAKYQGAAVAMCEVSWSKRLLKNLHEEVSDPTEVYCDNLSSIKLAKNPVFSCADEANRKCTVISFGSESFPERSN